jgi:leucyl aminopeptidase (aminopeptidase T)
LGGKKVDEMRFAARNVVRTCLGVKREEKFLIIADTETKEIGEAIFIEGLEAGAEVMLTVMKPRSRHGEEPPEPIAMIWPTFDVYVAPTKFSLTHTQARLNATNQGVRGVTMPGITKEIFVRTMAIDYTEVKKLVDRMADAIEASKSLKIASPNGTDIQMSIAGRKIFRDTGIVTERSGFGNLPAGEVCLAPIEGTASGKVVFDGSMAGVGVLESPIEIVVKDGFAVSVEGGEEAEKLRRMLDSVGEKAYNIAEIGVGANPKADLMGNVLVDEKVYGTVHIALGDNTVLGGSVKAGIHLDGVIKKPTLFADDRTLIREGNWLI